MSDVMQTCAIICLTFSFTLLPKRNSSFLERARDEMTWNFHKRTFLNKYNHPFLLQRCIALYHASFQLSLSNESQTLWFYNPIYFMERRVVIWKDAGGQYEKGDNSLMTICDKLKMMMIIIWYYFLGIGSPFLNSISAGATVEIFFYIIKYLICL